MDGTNHLSRVTSDPEDNMGINAATKGAMPACLAPL